MTMLNRVRHDGLPISFVEVLRRRACEASEAVAYRFLVDGEREEVSWTYGELDRRARAIAAELQGVLRTGDRVLLWYAPGLEFPAALLGCFYAAMVAVPAYVPPRHRSRDWVEATVTDAHPGAVLTTGDLRQSLQSRFGEQGCLGRAVWISTDRLDSLRAEQWRPPSLSAEMLACLQYTSGSTAMPKGVVLTHGNLIWNSEMIRQAFAHSPHTLGVSWLPPYHDMGLIGGLLQPLYAGCPQVLLSPLHVVQRPIRWFRAISRYRATTSGGPNFIYDLCVRSIGAEELYELDLSTWELAFNGAEPVRAETLERFADKFAACGFRKTAFFPCYGLAEGTLLVSGGPKGRGATVKAISRKALEFEGRLSSSGSVERSHPALRPHSAAAFAVERGGRERLVVVQEVRRNGRQMDLETVLVSIRQSITEEHEIAVDAIVLVRTGALPKTSSGKIRRRRCREQFLGDELEVVREWHCQDLGGLIKQDAARVSGDGAAGSADGAEGFCRRGGRAAVGRVPGQHRAVRRGVLRRLAP